MIQRYEYTYNDDMIESPEGEWVRWEDVEAILKLASNAVSQCIAETGRAPDGCLVPLDSLAKGEASE